MLQPVSKIKVQLGLGGDKSVQKFFTSSCRKHMDKFVPREIGLLRANVREGLDYVEYSSPYAHYMYEGIVYVDPKTNKGAFYNENYGFWSRKGVEKIPSTRKINYHTPGTGAHWDKLMWSVEKNKVIQEVENFMARRTR